MTAKQYRSARNTLQWTHEQLAEYIGKTPRQSYRYANGTIEIPDAVAKLVKRLVEDRLTMSARKFDERVARL